MQRSDKKRLLDLTKPGKIMQQVRELEPRFSHLEYLEMNPDLEEMQITNHIALYAHYYLKGHEEGRPAFNPYQAKLTELPENFA